MKKNSLFLAFAFFVSVFLYTSIIKQLYYFAVDITLLSFFIISCLYLALEKRIKVSTDVFLLLAFLFCLIFSLIISDSEEVGSYKLLATAPGFLVGLYLLTLNYNIYKAKRYLDMFCVLSVPTALYFIYLLPLLFTSAIGQGDVVKSIYLSLPFYLCISILYAVNFFPKNKLLYSIIISINLIAVLISGARGPLLGLFISLFILFIVNFKTLIKGALFRFFYIVPIVFFVFSYIFEGGDSSVYMMLERTIARMELLFTGGGSSVSERLYALKEMYNVGFDNFSSVLFGKGLGTFGMEVYGVDSYYYPHNVFLELAFEAGIITLTIFLLFIFIVLYKARNGLSLGLFYSVFIFLIFNFMKSYSIVGLRLFIPIFIFAYLLNIYHIQKKDHNNVST
ncbi:O-antigen ligase family protein [Pseudoalteromonas sp. BZP1]|uniref:O-antigen ligase family protein n=1 Tax=unclassified Pseudoalteromonas TaxID=194690 RepID=UPI0032C44A31